MSSSSSSWAFEHPNARGVLLPGQTKCHTGKLVPRVNRADPLADPFEPDQCPVPCSPCGAFPPPTPDHSDDEADDGGKENVSLASDEPKVKSGALPLESSRARLMGVAPCGSALKWSCCGACCGACTVWGEDGYALADADKHEGALRAAEYASWDGCTPIPEDVAAPAVPPRAVPGDRLGRIDVGRGAIACVAVARDGGAIAAGMTDGSFSVYEANPLEDDLAPTLLGTVHPGVPPFRRPKVKTWMDSDSEDEDGPPRRAAAPPPAPPPPQPARETDAADAETDAEKTNAEKDAEKDAADKDAAEKTNAENDAENDVDDSSSDAPPPGPPSTEGGHLGAVTSMAFAPDGASLYTGSRDGTVKRWSVPDLELMCTFEQGSTGNTGASQASSAGGSPTSAGGSKSSGGGSKSSGGAAAAPGGGSPEGILSVLLSSDGSLLRAGGTKTALLTWDAKSGERLGVMYQGKLETKGKDGLGVDDVDDDGDDGDEGGARRKRSSSSDSFEPPRAKTPEEVEAEEAAALELEREEEARTTRTRCKGPWANHIGALRSTPRFFGGSSSSGDDSVLTGSRDGAIRRWLPEARRCETRFVAHANAPVGAFAVTPDGGELVSGGAAGSGELKHFRWAPVAGTVDQTFSKGEARSGAGAGAYVRVKTLRLPEPNHKRPAHPSGVVAVVISADERFAYTAGADEEEPVRQWSMEDGAPTLRIDDAHSGGVTAMALLPDGPAPGELGQGAVDKAAAAAKGARLVTAGADGYVAVWAVHANDAVAGATLAAKNAQRSAGYAATEIQRKQERRATREPELSRGDWAVKARKALPAIERAKFPVNRDGEPKDLEDLTAKELMLMTSAELITCCLAHGLLCLDPKAPPKTKREIARAMVAYFAEEREKAKIRMRQERLNRT